MSKRTTVMVMGLVGWLWSHTAYAQQSIVINAGYFSARGAESRIFDDVVLENLNDFAIDVKDFNGGTVNAEWLVGLGDFFDVGVGVGFYRQTVPSVYFDFIDEEGFEIEQDFRLRVAPVTATIRVLPLGRHAAIEPFLGVGVGVFNWRYTEVGDFIDFNTDEVFFDEFVADGTDVGGVVFGGVRFPVSDHVSVGGELRYQFANGRVGIDQGFLAERIDLSGLTSSLSLQFSF